MNLNDIIIVVGIAVFLLPVVYMLGYARREQQHGKTVEQCKKNVSYQRNALIALHKDDLDACHAQIEQERNVIRELEISLLKAGEAVELERQALESMTKQWVYADKYRKAIVELLHINHLWNFSIHGDRPMEMLAVVVKAEREEALDPKVSQKAKNLFVKGVRKGAKQGREQMRKLMQKSIDNQALTIQSLNADLKASHEEWDSLLSRKNIAQQALNNVMADKMPIRSIRKAFKVAVLNERGRLTELAKKGA